ncbi:MAG: tRNA (adenosine(37)-N6)-threonylcarbamoyltransferase complex dimerization subunit type 1 TsaB [Bacillota bacterium]
MKILGIDTAGDTLGLAAVCGGSVLGEMILRAPRRASALLPGAADRLLEELRLTLADMDAAAVTLGPGSFTGLRIGTALVAGLCHSRRLTPVGVCSTEALVSSVAVPSGGYALGALRAGRGAAFAALYRREEEEDADGHWFPTEVVAPGRRSVREMEELLAERVPGGAPVVWVSDSREILPDPGTGVHRAVGVIRPGAVAIIGGRRIREGRELSPERIYPQYMHPSGAEMSRKED